MQDGGRILFLRRVNGLEPHSKFPPVCTIAQIEVRRRGTVLWREMLFAVERVMDTNQRQLAISVLGCLREDLVYAHLNNGSRILDVADLRQYLYEQMGRIRTDGLVMDALIGNHDGRGIGKSNGHNGKAHQ
jgi:hypothetical protein